MSAKSHQFVKGITKCGCIISTCDFWVAGKEDGGIVNESAVKDNGKMFCIVCGEKFYPGKTDPCKGHKKVIHQSKPAVVDSSAPKANVDLVNVGRGGPRHANASRGRGGSHRGRGGKPRGDSSKSRRKDKGPRVPENARFAEMRVSKFKAFLYSAKTKLELDKIAGTYADLLTVAHKQRKELDESIAILEGFYNDLDNVKADVLNKLKSNVVAVVDAVDSSNLDLQSKLEELNLGEESKSVDDDDDDASEYSQESQMINESGSTSESWADMDERERLSNGNLTGSN